MKRSKRRDPRAEPFASAVSRDKRDELVKRLEEGDITGEEFDVLAWDAERAQAKQSAANEQLRGHSPTDLFSDPGESAHSAGQTGVYLLKTLTRAGRLGATTRAQRKAYGFRRHDASSPEAAIHNRWRLALNEIIGGWLKAAGRPPRNGEAARAICLVIKEANFQTVRGWLTREEQAGRIVLHHKR